MYLHIPQMVSHGHKVHYHQHKFGCLCYGKDKFVAVAYNTNVVAYALDADPKFITSKIYNSNTLEINNRSENTNSNLRYRATVIGNTLLPDKFHMNNPRFTK